ncbi:hypothetical protein M3223_18340, partial [Paenibacillus pasadenensis]|nr:hypothetical protein [Paenibacillus pasadenensis]
IAPRAGAAALCAPRGRSRCAGGARGARAPRSAAGGAARRSCGAAAQAGAPARRGRRRSGIGRSRRRSRARGGACAAAGASRSGAAAAARGLGRGRALRGSDGMARAGAGGAQGRGSGAVCPERSSNCGERPGDKAGLNKPSLTGIAAHSLPTRRCRISSNCLGREHAPHNGHSRAFSASAADPEPFAQDGNRRT